MFNHRTGAAQFLRFCMVGVANTLVDLTAFFGLTLGGIPYLPAQALSYSAGVANSFFFNRKWTFRVTRQASVPEVIKFVIVNGLSLSLSSGLLYVLHDVTHLQLWLSKFSATGGGMVVNFLGSRLWVFTES